MNVKFFKSLLPKVTKDLIAYEWIHLETYKGLHIPDVHYHHKDLEPGKACIGRVIAVGPKVKEIKAGELILFGEYGADSGAYLEKDKVYFTHEFEIEAIFDILPSDFITPERTMNV